MKRPIEPKRPSIYKPDEPTEASKTLEQFKIIKSISFDDGNYAFNDIISKLQIENEKPDQLIYQFSSQDEYETGGYLTIQIGKMVKVPNPYYQEQVKRYKQQLAYYNKVLPKYQEKMMQYEAKMKEYRKLLKEYEQWEKEQTIIRMEKQLRQLKAETKLSQ